MCGLVLGAFLISSLSGQTAADSVIQRRDASLKGVTGIVVIVVTNSNLSSETIGPRLDKEKLRTSAELRLRKAGIKVIPNNSPYGPDDGFLLMKLDLFAPAHAPLVTYRVDLGFYQKAILLRKAQTGGADWVPVATWSNDSLGTVGTDNVGDVRSQFDDLIDEFANKYLEQNPTR